MSIPRLLVTCCVVSLFSLPIQARQPQTAGTEGLVDVRVVTDEADAVLDLLAGRANGEVPGETDWQHLESTEGYRRLKQRDESFGVEAFDAGFRDWLLAVDPADLGRLRDGVDRWRTLDAGTAGRTAQAYLPQGTPLRATIYPVLKPRANSFVFEIDTDPAIFMYVSGETSEGELANTLAHELHHIGTRAGCPDSDPDPPSQAAGDVLRWMGAFAEGLAMLAAAGGPNVHPHEGRPTEEWVIWERDIALFDRDLRRIERFFLDILAADLDAEAQRPRFFELISTQDVPQGPFYTVGWKMGALVEQRFGRQAVIDAICDMPRLLVAYNQIAEENPRGDGGSLPVWNPELLQAIGAPDLVSTWKAQPENAFRQRLHGTADGTAEASVFDVQSYGLSIELDFEKAPDLGESWRRLTSLVNTLDGVAEINLRNVSESPVEEIPLLLNRLMKVTKVQVDGQPRAFRQQLVGLEGREALQVRHITVSLAGPLLPTRQLTLTVEYTGQLVGYPESGTFYVRETLNPDFTILRSETFCYPQVAPPIAADVGFANRHDSFDQRLEVAVPAGHVVVNGGRSTGVEERDGMTVFSFASHEPDSAIQLPVAPYELLETQGHRIYHFAESAAGVGQLAKRMELVLALFESWFGLPRRDRGLVIAEIPEAFGSQAGDLILQTSGAFNDPEKYGQFYHELSHLWNAPDIDPQPARWNEGLAMFLQGVAEEELGDEGRLEELLSGAYRRLKKQLERDEKLALVAPIDYGKENMTRLSYRTALLLFGLLDEAVGREELLAFLGSYFRAHHENGSRDAGFVASLGGELGDGARELVREWFSTTEFTARLENSASWQDLREAVTGGQ